MEENEHINKHLKESLDQYLVQPKLGSFDGILKKLEKKRRKRFLFLFFPGVLLLMLGAFFVLNDPADSKISFNTVSDKNTSINKPEGKNNDPLTHRGYTGNSAVNKKTNATQKASESSPVSKTGTISSAFRKKSRSSKETTGLNRVKQVFAKDGAHENKKEISNETLEEVIGVDEAPIVEADKLDQKFLYWPVSMHGDLIHNSNLNENALLTENDSLKKKRKVKFLLGAAFSPQSGNYQFSKSSTTSIDSSYSNTYLKNRKEQSKFKYNYALGIKAGILIKDKWEFLLGFGLQRYNQEEKIMALTTKGPVPTVGNYNQLESVAFNNAVVAQPNVIYISKYNYFDYSLEGSRIYDLKNSLRIKAGLGFHLQQLSLRTRSSMIVVESPDHFYYGNGYNSSINRWQSVLSVKTGLIEDLTKTIQIQFCPNFYYSPNSMFNKDYIIKQKSYGFGLEALLLFKIR